MFRIKDAGSPIAHSQDLGSARVAKSTELCLYKSMNSAKYNTHGQVFMRIVSVRYSTDAKFSRESTV